MLRVWIQFSRLALCKRPSGQDQEPSAFVCVFVSESLCMNVGEGGRESYAFMQGTGRYEGADVCSCGKCEKHHWYGILSFLVITLEGSIASFPQRLDNEPSLEWWNAATCSLPLCPADPGSQSVWNAYIGSDSAGTQLLLLSHDVHETFEPNFHPGCKSVPASGRAGEQIPCYKS